MDSHSDIGRVVPGPQHDRALQTTPTMSFSLEESLGQLVKHGHIDREDALVCANHPDDLNGLLKS